MDDSNGEDQFQQSPDAPGGLTAEPDLLADQDIIIDGESGASAKITDDQTIVDIGNKEAPQRDTTDSGVREKTGLHEKGEADDLDKGTEQGQGASLMMESATSFPGEDRGKIVSTKEQSDSVPIETPTVVDNEGVLPYEVDSILLTGSELTTAENAAGETRDNLDQTSADKEANLMTDFETEVLQGANDNHGNEGSDAVLVLEGTSEDKPMEYVSDTAQSSSHIQIPADEIQTHDANGGAPAKDNMEDFASVDPESKQEKERLIQVADISTTELESNLLGVNETPINVDENIVHFEPDPQPIETVSPLVADTGEMKELQVDIDDGEDRQEADLGDPDLPLQDTISPVAVVPESLARMEELKPAVDKEGSEGDPDLEPPSAETISSLPVVTSESEVCVEEIKPAVDEDKGENNEELVDLEAPLKIAASSLAVVHDTKEIEVCEQDLQPNIDESGGEKEGRPRELDEPLQEPVSSLAVGDTDKSEVLEEQQPAIVEGKVKREEELSRDLEEPRKEPVSSPAVEDANEIDELEEIQPAIDEGGGEREEEPQDFQDKSNDIAEDNVSDSDESQVNSLPSLPDDATSSDKADENGAVAADNGSIETADNTTYSDKADGIGAIAIDTEPQNSENELNNAELNITRALDEDIAKETDLPNSDNELEQENLNIAGIQGLPRWKEGDTCETLSELSPQVVEEENINQDQALETCASPDEHSTSADLVDTNEMPSEESVFDKCEAVIPPSSSDISTNVIPTQNPERSEDVGAVGETLLQDDEPVSVEVVSHDDYTSTMQDDRPAADPTDAVVFNGASKEVPEDDKLRGNNDEVIGAVSDGHERVQIPEAAALMQDIPEPVTVPSSMGAVSLQTKEETEENEKQISETDKIILSDPSVFVDTGETVTESVDEGHSIQEIAQAPVTPDPKQTETEPADTRENYETRHDLVPTVSSTDNEESQSFQDTSSATSHDLVTTVNSTDEDKEPDDVRQQSETRHDPVPTVLSIKEEDVQLYQDTSPLLDTSSKQKKSILTEERAPVKPDVPDVVPSTQYEEQEASGPHDEKAPLVKKDKDESKTSYGTSEIDDEDVKKKKPSNFYLRIRDLVHSYCNIL